MIEKILKDIDIGLIALHTCRGNHFKDDLRQEIYLYILEMPKERLKSLYQSGELKPYLYRTAWIMFNGRNGSFYKKYRIENEIYIEGEEEDLQGMIREIINESNLDEIERLWLEVYLELDCNKTWIESRTGISRSAVAKQINKIIRKCKNSL